jgi:hypothetical protein
MSFILAARRGGELQVNAWNWRPTLELLLNENLIDRKRYELLGANGCGAGVDGELANRFADAIERRLKLADMKEGHRMLADLTITSAQRKPVAFSATEAPSRWMSTISTPRPMNGWSHSESFAGRRAVSK